MAPVVRVRLPPLPTSTPQPGRWCPRGRTGPLLPSTTGPFLDSAEGAAQQTYDLAPILSVDEAASFLRLNRKTVYDAVAAREMPGRRIRNRVVIPRDALLEWLQGYDCVLPRKRGR
jgi:excisionase family DNA binding protein